MKLSFFPALIFAPVFIVVANADSSSLTWCPDFTGTWVAPRIGSKYYTTIVQTDCKSLTWSATEVTSYGAHFDYPPKNIPLDKEKPLGNGSVIYSFKSALPQNQVLSIRFFDGYAHQLKRYDEIRIENSSGNEISAAEPGDIMRWTTDDSVYTYPYEKSYRVK